MGVRDACEYADVCTHMCMWRSEENIRCPALSLPYLWNCFEIVTLVQTWSFGCCWPATSGGPVSVWAFLIVAEYGCTCLHLAFYIGLEDLNRI